MSCSLAGSRPAQAAAGGLGVLAGLEQRRREGMDGHRVTGVGLAADAVDEGVVEAEAVLNLVLLASLLT